MSLGRIQQALADWTDGPLAHLPSGLLPRQRRLARPRAAISHNLLRAASALASPAPVTAPHGRAPGAQKSITRTHAVDRG